MFKEFWDSKRHIVGAVGIVVAIGALFLAIPLPQDNAQARTALLNLQLIWLILISLGLIVLAWQTITFLFQVAPPGADLKTLPPHLGYYARLSVWGLTFWILSAIWAYMWTLYRQPLTYLISRAGGLASALLIGIYVFIIRGKIEAQFKEHPISQFLAQAGTVILWALLNDILTTATTKLNLSWTEIQSGFIPSLTLTGSIAIIAFGLRLLVIRSKPTPGRKLGS